jgi:hypothetical protein
MEKPMSEPTLPPADKQPRKELSLIELETILNQPPSWRKRLTRLGLLLAAAGIALALVWSTFGPDTSSVPLPVTLSPLLLILSNVNYGTITINGKQQPGQVPMVISLHSNTSYTLDITLNAPPFLPRSCHVQLSEDGFAHSDTPHCNTSTATPDESLNAPTINGGKVLPAFEVDFPLTLNDLPSDQQSQVTRLLTQTLTNQQEIPVPAGSYFAVGVDAAGKITSQRASESLRASASVVPFAPRQNQYAGPCAAFICVGGFETHTASSSYDDVWNILVVIAPRWRFTSATGVAISDVQFTLENSVPFLLSYDEASGWDITSGLDDNQLANTFCLTGQNILEQLTTSGSVSTGASHDRGAAGCELVLDVNAVDQGLYLWRFGVLLTVDARARAAHPELPVAPPDEVAAVTNP